MGKPGFKTAENFGDPNKFYRVFSGNQAYEDILESGKIRTQGSPSYKGTNPHLMLSEHPSLADRIKSRPTAWPSFAKGKADLSFAQGLPDHYIIETEEKLIPSKSGRHSRGSTYFPMDEKGLDVDKTKTKIYKHLGEGKYEQVRSTNKGFGTAAKEMAQAAPMETPYGKSLLSYTPEGKIAGKTGAALRGLGKAASKLAGPVGAVLTAIDLSQALGEVQDKGAAKIAEDYKKSKMAESEAEILTPEADQFRESLKSRRTELEILRAELEIKRKQEERAKERESRGIERQARVRDTLEQTGLIP